MWELDCNKGWGQKNWCFLIMVLEKTLFFFSSIFISCRLITLQYCSGFCHTLTWISHGFTCIPHPDPPSHLPLHPIPLGLPSAPGPSTCLMHPAWACDLFHPRQYTCFNAVLLKHPTLALLHASQDGCYPKAINAGEDVEKREPSYTVGGNAN